MVLDCVASHYRPLEMNLVQRLTGPGTAGAPAVPSDGREVGKADGSVVAVAAGKLNAHIYFRLVRWNCEASFLS